MGALPLPLTNSYKERALKLARKVHKRNVRGLVDWRTGVPGLAPSLLPRPGAVAITVTTTALAGECRVVWCGATRASRQPGFGCGSSLSPLAALERGASRLRLGGWGRPMGRPYGPAGTTDYGALGALRSAHTG